MLRAEKSRFLFKMVAKVSIAIVIVIVIEKNPEPLGSLDCGGPPPLLNFETINSAHKFKSARGLAHSKALRAKKEA